MSSGADQDWLAGGHLVMARYGGHQNQIGKVVCYDLPRSRWVIDWGADKGGSGRESSSNLKPAAFQVGGSPTRRLIRAGPHAPPRALKPPPDGACGRGRAFIHSFIRW